jgi:hypothetical protein
VAYSDSVVVTASYSTSGAGTGRITLTATPTQPSGSAGSGAWDLTVANPSGTVAPDATPVQQNFNTAATQVFTIANPGLARTGYLLEVDCSGTALRRGGSGQLRGPVWTLSTG